MKVIVTIQKPVLIQKSCRFSPFRAVPCTIFRKKNIMTQLSYHLVKSRRKTIAIEIRPDKTIVVKAPNHLSDEAVWEAVARKAAGEAAAVAEISTLTGI